MRSFFRIVKESCPSGLCLLTRVCLMAAIGLSVLLIVSTHAGCAHTRPGLDREGAVLGVATNAAASVQAVVQTVPPPWQPFADCAAAIIATALAAWSTSHSRRLKALEDAPSPAGQLVGGAAPKT
jgi:hypothetical protein